MAAVPSLSRIMLIILAFLTACLAATLIITVGSSLRGLISAHLNAFGLRDVSILVKAIASFGQLIFSVVVAFAVLPAVIIAVTAEFYRLQSWLLYAVTGAVVSVVCQIVTVVFISVVWSQVGMPSKPPPEFGVPSADMITVFVVAGSAAGLVYWAMAGRSAGRWRQNRTGTHEGGADPVSPVG
jgi:hypothetical protein